MTSTEGLINFASQIGSLSVSLQCRQQSAKVTAEDMGVLLFDKGSR